jgi:hypothetical protein
MKFISPYERYKLMIPFMEAQRKRELAAEEERRKQLLEEKKKQLPELEIVKIEDDDVVEMSLRDAKRAKRPHQDSPAVEANPNKRWKKKKEDEPSETLSSAIEAELKNISDRVDEIKKNKKGKPIKQSEIRQSSNKPVNFDYSTVTYERFQGGSGPSNGNSNQKFQQKFKGGKKGKGQNIDKMFNFSNFKLNKK